MSHVDNLSEKVLLLPLQNVALAAFIIPLFYTFDPLRLQCKPRVGCPLSHAKLSTPFSRPLRLFLSVGPRGCAHCASAPVSLRLSLSLCVCVCECIVYVCVSLSLSALPVSLLCFALLRGRTTSSPRGPRSLRTPSTILLDGLGCAAELRSDRMSDCFAPVGAGGTHTACRSLSLSLSPGLGDGSTSAGRVAHPMFYWVCGDGALSLSLSLSLSLALSPLSDSLSLGIRLDLFVARSFSLPLSLPGMSCSGSPGLNPTQNIFGSGAGGGGKRELYGVAHAAARANHTN